MLQDGVISPSSPYFDARIPFAAFNIANSLGAWLGGAAIAAGWGYESPNLVAAGLALVGLFVALGSGRLELVQRARTRVPA